MATAQSSDVTPSARIIRAFFALLIKRRSVVARSILFAGLAIAFANGFYLVREGESAAKRRFGKLVTANIPPGLHWRIPFRIEKVNVLPTEKLYRIEVVGEISPSLPMLTGDNNFANSTLAIQYRISNLQQFLFGHENTEGILKDIIRGHFIDTISSAFIDMVLASEKRNVESQIRKKSTAQIKQMELGVELVSVGIVFIEPPTEAVAAFRAVNDARLNKKTVTSQTHQRTEDLLARSRGDSQGLVDDARAQANKRVAQSRASSSRFAALLEQNQVEPAQTRMTEYWNSIRRILGQAKIVVLDPNEKPNLAVNLIEAPEPFPMGMATGGVVGSGHSPLKATGTNRNESALHPTAAALHSRGSWLNLDRRPGMGTHLDSKEAHPFPVSNNVASNLPPDSLGVTTQSEKKAAPPSSPSKLKGDRQLGEPGKASKDKK